MTGTNGAARAMVDAYADAVARKDVDAFLRLYDPGVRVFDAWDTWSHEGQAAWRQCIDAWFASSDGVSVNFEDVSEDQADDFAAVTAIVTYAALAPDGTRSAEIQNRITWILRNHGGRWRIVHEHTSVPVDLGHAKPILRRDIDSVRSFASVDRYL